MLAANQRIWGFESNFGGLADLTCVKANQLMPKPAHLSWEESAVNALCNSTSYRMLVSKNGAAMKQGDVVFVWGATGGLGGYACQYVLNGGGTPVGVVSSPDKVELLHELGVEAAIDREASDANKLIGQGRIQPILSAVHRLDDVGEAAYQVHRNLHEGKIGVLCLAPEEGLGIDDPEFRAKVGEDKITLFRRHS